MKKDIHPKEYRPVIFHDNTSGESFLIDSAVETKEEGEWTDGKKYPQFNIEISSASHPFYTGQQTVVDSAGRVQKFKQRKEQAVKEVKSKRVKKEEKKTKRASATKAKK